MFHKLSSTLSDNFISTLISLFAVIVIFFLIKLFFIRKIDIEKRKKQVTIRVFYVAVLAFLFLMARIWVDGFMHLIAVLGLVSAGLVVTNKETIMNIVGWMIITWRGVFFEDDLIQILNYKGYVKTIGLLYFTLQEVSDYDFSKITGKEIKVPNGLASNNAIVNYSQCAKLILSDCRIKLPAKDFQEQRKVLITSFKQVLNDFYKKNLNYSQLFISRYDECLKGKIDLTPQLVVSADFCNGETLDCTIQFYCFAEDKRQIIDLFANQLSVILSV